MKPLNMRPNETSGYLFSFCGLDGCGKTTMLTRLEKELGEKPTVVATGGLSKEIICHCDTNIIYNENLLLDGLRVIYEKNN